MKKVILISLCFVLSSCFKEPKKNTTIEIPTEKVTTETNNETVTELLQEITDCAAQKRVGNLLGHHHRLSVDTGVQTADRRRRSRPTRSAPEQSRSNSPTA